MALTVEDRLEIYELLALHGHLMDAGDFARLDDVDLAIPNSPATSLGPQCGCSTEKRSSTRAALRTLAGI